MQHLQLFKTQEPTISKIQEIVTHLDRGGEFRLPSPDHFLFGIPASYLPRCVALKELTIITRRIDKCEGYCLHTPGRIRFYELDNDRLSVEGKSGLSPHTLDQLQGSLALDKEMFSNTTTALEKKNLGISGWKMPTLKYAEGCTGLGRRGLYTFIDPRPVTYL
jgi:hypothetical protein